MMTPPLAALVRPLAILTVLIAVLAAPVARAQFQAAPAQEPAEAPVDAQLSREALIEALEDPAIRAQLIEALRSPPDGTAETADSTAATDTADAEPAPAEETLAQRAAALTQTVVADIIDSTARMVSDFGRLALIPRLLTEDRRATILADFWPLLGTVLVTLISYRLLRIVGRRLRLAVYDRAGAMVSRVRALVFQLLFRMAAVGLAATLGYLLGVLIFADGQLLTSQALFLNAFLLFGLLSAALALFVSRDRRDITYSRLPFTIESAIYRASRWVLGILTFGLVAIVPISQIWVNFVLARSLRTIVIALAAIAALAAIYRVSRAIRRHGAEAEAAARAEAEAKSDAETGGTPDATATVASHTLGLWDRVWPGLATLYVLVTLGVALSNPNQMAELVGRATVFSAVGLAAMLFALRLLSHVGDKPRLPLPQTVSTLLPPLGDRLSAFVPPLMVGVSALLIASAVLLFLGGWGLIDIANWYTDAGSELAWRIASFALIAVALILLWSVLTSWIDTRLSSELSGAHVTARSRTLLALFKNVVTIALVVFGGMTALSELGIDIAPLLAGAGVIGLAIGFGAQKLVQDIITGIFIQLENAINEGEVITVAGITGAVEKLTIRSVALRDLTGAYHLIPFSAVDTVTNFMRGFGFHVEVVGVAYDTDLAKAKAALHKAFDTLKAGPLGGDIIEPLDWQGVVGLADSSVNLRVRIKTLPGKQWGVGRAYTEEVKRELDAAGVEIPFPHRELKLPRSMVEALAGSRARPEAVEG